MFSTFDSLLWQRYSSVFLKEHMNYRYIKKVNYMSITLQL